MAHATWSGLPLAIAVCFVSVTGFAYPKAHRAAPGCEWYDTGTAALPLRDGHLDFIDAATLKPFKDALPRIAKPEVDALLRSSSTIWYDDRSMVFLYQDSVEVVTGGRANCVGRSVGERNRNNPGIAKLLNYFGPDYKFKYPFRTVAGTDNVTNVKTLNFWTPPQKNGVTLPVKYWQVGSRGRWHWVFPVGTVFGEVLYEQGPDQKWIAFEVRVRRRYLDGWAVDLFRPFATSAGLAQAIRTRRPDWERSTNLTRVMSHLGDRSTLSAHRLTSEAYGKVFPPITGALDVLPEIQDTALVTELLTQTTFVSCEGAIWKENGTLETYAPASSSLFNIVPKGYEMGMIPVNEVSCNRCHMETGHPLADFEFDIILYGEMWGEDRIFTWHLFEPHRYIFDTWDDEDQSRKLNPRLVQAKLLRNERVGQNDPDYKVLPVPYEESH